MSNGECKKMHLKEYLDKNSIKYSGFADQLGISYRSLWAIMNGKVDPYLSLALKIEKLTRKNVKCADINLARELKKKQREESDGNQDCKNS